MFRTILRREIQETFSSSTLLSALIVLTMLVMLSAYIQARYYQRLVGDYAVRQSIPRAENSSQTIVLIRPLPPLLPFFNGVYDGLPDEFRLRSDSVTINPLSGDITPLDSLFPKIDLSFIIGILMTLLTILLTHDTIAGDREQGTLKLILAGPVKRRTVLAAKLTGVILLVAIILIYVVSLYTTVIIIFSDKTVNLSAANLSVITLCTLAALLVLMVIAALGAAISASVRRSLVSLTACTSIWIISILIWPSLGPKIASSFEMVSTWEATQRDIALKATELMHEELAEHRKTAADLKAQGVDVESAWQRYLKLKYRWVKRKNEVIGRLVEERKTQIRDQRAIAVHASLLSPYVAFREILGTFCDTGLESYDDFLMAVERYEEQEFLPGSFDLLSRQKPWLNVANQEDDRLQLRPIEVPPPDLFKRLAAAAWPLGILIAELLFLMILGILGFERYDVRGLRNNHSPPTKAGR
jgi:ABC-type transport system involved in multi-copper enzyme maturation permease subunit